MKIKPKFALLSGLSAVLIGGACCWLPALVILLGGSASLLAVSNFMSKFTIPLFILGGVSILVGIWLFRKNRKSKTGLLILESVITCPHCSNQEKEIMPENSCQYFYECKKCGTTLKPREGDCCVFCSFGSVKCPPIQRDENCC